MWHISKLPADDTLVALRDVPIGMIAYHPNTKNYYFMVEGGAFFFCSHPGTNPLFIPKTSFSSVCDYRLAPKGTRIELIQE